MKDATITFKTVLLFNGEEIYRTIQTHRATIAGISRIITSRNGAGEGWGVRIAPSDEKKVVAWIEAHGLDPVGVLGAAAPMRYAF